jgi:hypothetical protein
MYWLVRQTVGSDYDLFSKLALAASMGIPEAADVYLDDYAQIHQLGGLTQSTLRISTSDGASALQMLSVGVVLNDLSFASSLFSVGGVTCR